MEPEGTHDVTLGAHRRPVCSAAHVLSLSRVPWHPRGFAPDGEQRTELERHRLSSSSSPQPARHRRRPRPERNLGLLRLRRHQRCEPRHPLQRLEHDLHRAIAVRRLERLADLPRSRQRQTLAGDGLGRNRLCRDVSRRNMQIGSRRAEMPARELAARGNRDAPHDEKGPGVASRASFIER